MERTYLIELDRWGITQGLPTKPYTEADFYAADANVAGITNAIAWAHGEGYRTIVLPKGEYAVHYPRTIEIKNDDITLDLNRSTLKVIYDSDSKSPFDTRTDADYYKFPARGVTIGIYGASNVRVTKGILKGDRYDRSFSNSLENRMEQTYGICVSKSSHYCRVDNNDISGYMGDGVTMENSAFGEYVEWTMGLTANNVDGTGALVPSTEHSTSILLPVLKPAIAAPRFNAMMIIGFGYTRPTNIITKDVGIHFYRADGSYIGGYAEKKVFAPITIPRDAEKYRFTFYNEPNLQKDMQMHLKFGLTPQYTTVEDNRIYENHRGGITPGGNYTVIQRNTIFGIGKTTMLDGKPLFFDPTRYGINQEDTYGDYTTIKDNIIYDCFAGIFCGTYNSIIEGNKVYNASSVAINLYALFKATVRDNFIWKSTGSTIGLMTSSFANAHVEITGNTIVGGNTNLGSGKGYHINFHDNVFVDPGYVTMPESATDVFRNNHFRYNTYSKSAGFVTVNRLEGCTFESVGTGTKRLVTLTTYEVDNCRFSNLYLRVTTKKQAQERERVTINGGAMANCEFETAIWAGKSRHVTIEGAKLLDTPVRVTMINIPLGEHSSLLLKRCNIEVTGATHTIEVQSNLVNSYASVDVEDCTIKLANSAITSLLKSFYPGVQRVIRARFKNTVVQAVGQTPLELAYIPSQSRVCLNSLVVARTRFENIVRPAITTEPFYDYDPATHGTQPPSEGYFFKGDTFLNADPVAAGFLGWVANSEGQASEVSWTPFGALIQP